MSFLNRFITEEDIQFECAGVVEHKRDMKTKMKRNIERYLMKNLERISIASNSIGHVVHSDDLEYSSAYSIFDNIKNLTMMMTFPEFAKKKSIPRRPRKLRLVSSSNPAITDEDSN